MKIRLIYQMSQYTIADWKAFKKEFKLTNKDIAEIIGTSEQNVKMQTNKKNENMSTWMKAFLFVWQATKTSTV